MVSVLPLGLVPGLLCSARLYAPQIPALGRLGLLPWPITGATPNWLQLLRASSPMLLTPPDLSREICAGISAARLVVVPDCGHLSTVEKLDVVNAALAEWLST